MKEQAYRVELFIQGRGWRNVGELYPHSGVVKTREEALKLGLYLILKKMQEREGEPYGATEGDIVGIKITEEQNQKPEKIPEEAEKIEWNDHKHRFYNRGKAYMLYKTWSWPD